MHSDRNIVIILLLEQSVKKQRPMLQYNNDNEHTK